jgi:hypothetical protein
MSMSKSASMDRSGKRTNGTRFAAIVCAFTVLWPVLAADAAGQAAAVPNFGPNSDTGWIPARPAGDDFIPPESGPGPVMSEKDHPYVPNGQGRVSYRIADLSNPILQPWAAERMKQPNEEVRAGKVPFTADSRCWPGGVPGFDIYARVRPIYFLQTPKEITIIEESDMQVRHIYLNVPHSANPSPSWYGESVGHYENGDTLVVDTIGQNDKTFVDDYRTPHTTQLHVVERYKLIDGGKTLQVSFTVEDPGAYNMPWSGMQIYHRKDLGPITEAVCAENHGSMFNDKIHPMPTADKPDF